jgi:hypothetical protein
MEDASTCHAPFSVGEIDNEMTPTLAHEAGEEWN